MNNLVTTWLEAERELYGSANASEALRAMNETLGTSYQSSMLWSWRHHDKSGRTPGPEARNYMVERSIPWILQKCGIRTTRGVTARIVEALLT